MRVKAIFKFFDLKENKLRLIGDEFEVSDLRFDEILNKGGNWVEKIEKKELTIAEIKAKLEEKGIEYNKNAKKDELLSFLND